MPIMNVRYRAGSLDGTAKETMARRLTEVLIAMEGGADGTTDLMPYCLAGCEPGPRFNLRFRQEHLTPDTERTENRAAQALMPPFR